MPRKTPRTPTTLTALHEAALRCAVEASDLDPGEPVSTLEVSRYLNALGNSCTRTRARDLMSELVRHGFVATGRHNRNIWRATPTGRRHVMAATTEAAIAELSGGSAVAGAPRCPKCGDPLRLCAAEDPACLHCDTCDWCGDPARPSRSGLKRVFASARHHGEQSEPDHEVGDLTAFIYTLTKLVDDQVVDRAVEQFFADHEEW